MVMFMEVQQCLLLQLQEVPLLPNLHLLSLLLCNPEVNHTLAWYNKCLIRYDIAGEIPQSQIES
jgi:hypothetical protein